MLDVERRRLRRRWVMMDGMSDFKMVYLDFYYFFAPDFSRAYGYRNLTAFLLKLFFIL